MLGYCFEPLNLIAINNSIYKSTNKPSKPPTTSSAGYARASVHKTNNLYSILSGFGDIKATSSGNGYNIFSNNLQLA
jgi:hypothetical protein